MHQFGVRPTYFQIWTIIITLGLPTKYKPSSHFVTFIENISNVVISQMTHVFGLSEKNWQKSYADMFTKIQH